MKKQAVNYLKAINKKVTKEHVCIYAGIMYVNAMRYGYIDGNVSDD